MLRTPPLLGRRRQIMPVGPRPKSFAPGWVWAVAGSGYLQAAALILAGFAVDVAPGARGFVGGDLVSGELQGPVGIVLIALGFVSLLACTLVVLGHGFALTALLGAGAGGTLALAASGSWAALVVPAAMAATVLTALLTPALDHLHPRTGVQ